MKLKITYPTKERINVTESTYKNVPAEAELEPVRIFRSPCGTGKAANRYYYSADFIAPRDAEFDYKGYIRANIWRKENPKFNPKDFKWTYNVCNL